MRLARKFSNWHNFLTEAAPYLADNAERLGISAAQLAAFNTLTAAFRTAWDLYQNPLTQTQAAAHNMQTAYRALRW